MSNDESMTKSEYPMTKKESEFLKGDVKKKPNARQSTIMKIYLDIRTLIFLRVSLRPAPVPKY